MPSNIITVEVYDTDKSNSSLPDEKLDDVIAWFCEKRSLVPMAYRDAAKVDFCAITEYEPNIRITYERPETEAETAEREKDEQRYADQRRQGELDTLRRLKAKYPEA